MKKIAGLVAVLSLVALVGQAAMVDRDFAMDVVTTGTNSVTYTLRGILESVYIDAPASKTGTVTVSSTEATLLTVSSTATDANYFPRAAMHTTAGAAATFNAYSTSATTNSVLSYSTSWTITTNNQVVWSTSNTPVAIATNTILTYAPSQTITTNSVVTYNAGTAGAQTWYTKQAMAGAITVQVVGAAGTTGTNTWTITLIYDQ